VGTFTVRRGRRYRATISLGLIESFAGNELIADKLRGAGFEEVSVSGSGTMRTAEGLWPNEDATAQMPEQITAVTEIEAV
jgi:hypothetical protein